MESYASIVVAALIGFFLGAALCYAILAYIYKHRRVRDELLKTKRKAIKAQRTLDRFLKTSLDMFQELNTAHAQYVQFLKEATAKIAPDEVGSHEFLNQDLDKILDDAKERMKKKAQESTSQTSVKEKTFKEVEGSLGEIPTPKVLKPTEVPDEILHPLPKQDNVKPQEDDKEPQEEPIKV